MYAILAVLLTLPTTSSAWELRIATSGASDYNVLGTAPTERACNEGRDARLRLFLNTLGDTSYLAVCQPVALLRPYNRSHR